MIKANIFEKDLIEGMQRNLRSNASTDIKKAIDYMNSAIDIFEDVGMISTANKILETIDEMIDSSWEDELKGGLADKKSPKDFNKKSLEQGIKVEMEHTNDLKIALEITMDHLTEDPEYYDKLATIEDHNNAKDSHIPSNSEQMVKNLLDHGTVFNAEDDILELDDIGDQELFEDE